MPSFKRRNQKSSAIVMSWCVNNNGIRQKSQERLKSDLGSQLFGSSARKITKFVKRASKRNQQQILIWYLNFYMISTHNVWCQFFCRFTRLGSSLRSSGSGRTGRSVCWTRRDGRRAGRTPFRRSNLSTDRLCPNYWVSLWLSAAHTRSWFGVINI